MDENTLPEPSLEESIKLLLMQVPTPVRDFILNNLGTKTQELMTRYQLHIDQGGILERELLLMLLGQEEPAEFVSALQETGIAPEIVQSLTKDINAEVFMKLRSAEEKTSVATAPAAPRTLLQDTPPLPQLENAPITSPAPQPIPQIPAPQPVSIPVPTPANVAAPSIVPPPPSAYVAQPSGGSEVRTMASDIAMVKAGEFPHYQSVPTAPIAPPSVSVIPPTQAPAQPQAVPPSAPQPRPQVAETAPLPKAPAPQSANRDALHQILKQYGVDPYREPPE